MKKTDKKKSRGILINVKKLGRIVKKLNKILSEEKLSISEAFLVLREYKKFLKQISEREADAVFEEKRVEEFMKQHDSHSKMVS